MEQHKQVWDSTRRFQEEQHTKVHSVNAHRTSMSPARAFSPTTMPLYTSCNRQNIATPQCAKKNREVRVGGGGVRKMPGKNRGGEWDMASKNETSKEGTRRFVNFNSSRKSSGSRSISDHKAVSRARLQLAATNFFNTPKLPKTESARTKSSRAGKRVKYKTCI